MVNCDAFTRSEHDECAIVGFSQGNGHLRHMINDLDLVMNMMISHLDACKGNRLSIFRDDERLGRELVIEDSTILQNLRSFGASIGDRSSERELNARFEEL